jgi:hypothetical protein
MVVPESMAVKVQFNIPVWLRRLDPCRRTEEGIEVEMALTGLMESIRGQPVVDWAQVEVRA